MDKLNVKDRIALLDDLAHYDEETNCEYWCAREIMELFGYTKWQNFIVAVNRAKASLESTKTPVERYFADASKIVKTGIGKPKEILDIKLTRYACYLIAQNGDPRKEEIAFAQSYFAIKTRKQELIEQRMSELSRLAVREQLTESEKRLSKNIYERGVDEGGFGRIRSKGDHALFNKTTQQMKERLGVPTNRPLADYLPAVTIAAKQLATEMTNLNVETSDMHGEKDITAEHVRNNQGVRGLLVDRGIKPEELPPAPDLKKLKRKVDSSTKSLKSESSTFSE